MKCDRCGMGLSIEDGDTVACEWCGFRLYPPVQPAVYDGGQAEPSTHMVRYEVARPNGVPGTWIPRATKCVRVVAPLAEDAPRRAYSEGERQWYTPLTASGLRAARHADAESLASINARMRRLWRADA